MVRSVRKGVLCHALFRRDVALSRARLEPLLRQADLDGVHLAVALRRRVADCFQPARQVRGAAARVDHEIGEERRGSLRLVGCAAYLYTGDGFAG